MPCRVGVQRLSSLARHRPGCGPSSSSPGARHHGLTHGLQDPNKLLPSLPAGLSLALRGLHSRPAPQAVGVQGLHICALARFPGWTHEDPVASLQ